MLQEGDYGGGLVEGRKVLGCKRRPALGGWGWRQNGGRGDVRGQSCEEIVEGMECCESLWERVGTHGDRVRLAI